jgi:Domain of unknown function (DUF3846)
MSDTPTSVRIFNNGDDATKVIVFDKDPGLAKLQETVGGYIEVVPYFKDWDGKHCVAICDEEAKIKGKPINLDATHIWYDQCPAIIGHDVLAGNIAIVIGGIR